MQKLAPGDLVILDQDEYWAESVVSGLGIVLAVNVVHEGYSTTRVLWSGPSPTFRIGFAGDDQLTRVDG